MTRRRHGGWAPHVVFELAWAGPRLTLGVWVPGGVPAFQVKRIAETSWPGAVAEIRAAGPPVLAGPVMAEGGEVAPAGGRDWLPLRAGERADPLTGVYAHGLYLGAHNAAVVQVAARPAGASRLARARAGAQGRGAATAGGALAGAGRALVRFVLDLVTELMRLGPSSAPRGHSPYGPPAAERRDPIWQAQSRAAVRKLTDVPLWEVAVRYAAATTLSGEPARNRVRGQAIALSSAFGAFSGDVELADRPLRHPADAVAQRGLRRGFVASTPELAALAHPPYAVATVAGLRRATARPVPPPPGVRRLPAMGGGADEW